MGLHGLLDGDPSLNHSHTRSDDFVETEFRPLEWAVPQRADDRCYAKLVCHRREKGGVAGERVVGLHLCGPHAGEITQGFAVAIKAGATKADFDRTVGIHPTIAEGLTVLSTTKRSSETAKQADC